MCNCNACNPISAECFLLQALLLSIKTPCPGQVFNIVDDDCSSRATAMAYAASLLSVELPEVGETREAQVRGEKKVSNTKAKDLLAWQPRFPSYKEGLQNVFEQEQASAGERRIKGRLRPLR